MQSYLGHLLFNVDAANLVFYKELFEFMGWHTMVDEPEILGVADNGRATLWFSSYVKQVTNDYDGPGMNHVAIGTESQQDIDAVAAYLRERNVALLFETPRHRPEFSSDESNTYYQVMFESPDRFLIECVYIGPKQ